MPEIEYKAKYHEPVSVSQSRLVFQPTKPAPAHFPPKFEIVVSQALAKAVVCREAEMKIKLKMK
jgi:hypothetical protein